MQSFAENKLDLHSYKIENFLLNCHDAPLSLRLPFNKIVFTVCNIYHHWVYSLRSYADMYIRFYIIQPYKNHFIAERKTEQEKLKLGAFSSLPTDDDREWWDTELKRQTGKRKSQKKIVNGAKSLMGYSVFFSSFFSLFQANLQRPFLCTEIWCA